MQASLTQPGQIFYDAIALAKPRITALALITAAVGMSLAPGGVSAKVACFGLLGITLLVAGASVLNMFLERDTDKLMDRTKDRPLPRGRLSPDFGLTLGSLLVGVAIPLLFLYVNPLTGWLGVLSLMSYVLIYTYLKRVTWVSLLIGAIPGAAPPLLGWSAATGTIGAAGLLLFAIIYFWQIPHFLAIGLFRRDDYARAGLKVFPLDQKLSTLRWQMLLSSIPLLPVSYGLYAWGYAGKIFLAIALGLGILFIGEILRGWFTKEKEKWGKRVFRVSLLYLTLLFIALMADGGMK